MNLELRLHKVNGTGAIAGIVAVMDDDGKLLFEDDVNLSKASSRHKLAQEIARRAKITETRAMNALIGLMADHRAHVTEAEQEAAPERTGQATELVELALQQAPSLFLDQLGRPHLSYLVGDHREVWPVRSRRTQDWLAKLFWDAKGKAAGSEGLRAALNTLSGIAAFKGERRRLSTRLAWSQGALWYDLGDGRAVRVRPGAWELAPDPPILFRRFNSQAPQVEPQPGGDIRRILEFINLRSEKDQLLLLVYMCVALVPDIPRPILVVHGEHGSAKSMLHEMLKSLLDPAAIRRTSPPENLREFVQQAFHHHALYLDNMSGLPTWLSDAFCRLATGDGFSKRELFSDDEDVIYPLQGLGGVNGVNLVASQPDFLDRSIIMHLEPIPDEARLEEKALRASFQEAKAGILGGMFDTLAAAMQEAGRVQLARKPRMADFAVWGVAVSRVLGQRDNDFLGAFGRNVREQSMAALEASLVAQALIRLMRGRDEWRGSATALLGELERYTDELKINTKSEGWPKAPHILSRRLREVLPNLRRLGLEVTWDNAKEERTISVHRTVEEASVASEASPGESER